MKNNFEICGDKVIIFLPRKDGVLQTTIDLADLSRVQEFPNAWSAWWSFSGQCFYVNGRMPSVNGKRQVVLLHKLIMKTPEGFVTDHINHDTLNNQRSNLRVVTQGQNAQNLSVGVKNKSGYRGVNWHKGAKKWVAQIKVNFKKIHLGYFDDVEEAAKVASAARARLLPYSLDALGGR